MAAIIQEKVWIDKKQYDEAERQYYERLAKLQNYNGSPDSKIPIVDTVYTFHPISEISNTPNSRMFLQSQEIPLIPPILSHSPKKSRKSKKEKSKKQASKRLAEQAALIDEALLKKDLHTSPSSSEKEMDNRVIYELEKESKKTSKKGKKVLKSDKAAKGNDASQAEKEMKLLKDKKDKQKQVHNKLVRYSIEDPENTKENQAYMNIFQMKIDCDIQADDEKEIKVLEDEKGKEVNFDEDFSEIRSSKKQGATDPNIFYFVQCYDDNIMVKIDDEKKQNTKDVKEPQKKKRDKNAGAKKINNAAKISDTVNIIDDAKEQGGDATVAGQSSLANEVAKARQHIKNSLECMDSVAALAGVPNVEIVSKISSLEQENANLKVVVEELRKLVLGVQQKVVSLEARIGGGASGPAPAAPKPAAAAKAEESDDGVDLFGSDSEDEGEEAAKIREARLAAYAAKKSKKPVLIAKSNIILDVKPWDDETDMKVLEAEVRKVTADGLLWGASKLVPLAYGIHKLQISCVVEDDKISIDWLQETLEAIEDYVQSVDIAAFNKV